MVPVPPANDEDKILNCNTTGHSSNIDEATKKKEKYCSINQSCLSLLGTDAATEVLCGHGLGAVIP